jgi:hypothetical protein
MVALFAVHDDRLCCYCSYCALPGENIQTVDHSRNATIHEYDGTRGRLVLLRTGTGYRWAPPPEVKWLTSS